MVSALLAVLAFGWLLARPRADYDRFYAVLQPHPWICQIVRVGFVLAGKQDEFDLQIALTQIEPIFLFGWDDVPAELPPELQQLGDQHPPSQSTPAAP